MEQNIVYSSKPETEVMLGDRVETRDFFRKCQGVVVYVPGKSKRHSQMHGDGQDYVGVILDKGALVLRKVMPDGKVRASLVFIGRGEVGELPMPSEDAEY